MTRHLLVIGAQRSGTTWVHDLLAAHPDVAMARPARPEPKVFLTDEGAARGHAWYDATYFAHGHGEAVYGEKSTSYLEHGEVADRALAVLGDPLALAVLRDPVRRARSHWAFSVDNGFETRDLPEVLEANLRGPLPWDPARSSVSPYAYLERGRYADYLRPWRERLGDDLKVAFHEELVSDPGAVARLLTDLGLDPAGAHPPRGSVNASSQADDGLDPDLVRRLRAYYRDSDRALADMLGRPLPWRTADQPDPSPHDQHEKDPA
ncbi:MAG: sulfotransferase family protein [Nocardioides sp.]